MVLAGAKLIEPTRDEVVRIVGGGVERRYPPQWPFELASAALSWIYVDAKYPLSSGLALRTVGHYAVERLQEEGVKFSVVGGLTMGASPLTVAISMASGDKNDVRHFEACKVPYDRYSEAEPLWITGARLEPGDRILVTEDVTSTGGSAERAIALIQDVCAEKQIDDVEVVGVCTVLDRGREAAIRFAALGISFVALTTYQDFELEPVN